jgi:hypothetical protein
MKTLARITDRQVTDQNASKRFWLWRHRDDRFGPHWLAFDSEFPTLDGGDPAVLGEPEYSAVSPSPAKVPK